VPEAIQAHLDMKPVKNEDRVKMKSDAIKIIDGMADVFEWRHPLPKEQK
jgi:hypothetical protein